MSVCMCAAAMPVLPSCFHDARYTCRYSLYRLSHQLVKNQCDSAQWRNRDGQVIITDGPSACTAQPVPPGQSGPARPIHKSSPGRGFYWRNQKMVGGAAPPRPPVG
eukprot:6179481-Pleurochrysis_carterae.AAC.1